MADKHGAFRKQALGTFVRSVRDRVTPQQAGIAGGQRRRTPGLRREEVAQLCDISVTWYTWIEQGRDVSVSATVWARLATVLQMTRAERTYLFELADVSDPDHDSAVVSAPTASLQACVDSINAPAYILDRHWDVLAFNAALDQVFAGWMSAQAHPNLLRFIFLDAQAPDIVVDWEIRANRVVAEFRADIGAYLDDGETSGLIDELLAGSPVFSHWWARQVVVEREGGLREFNHPQLGIRQFEQITFRLATQPDCKLVMLLHQRVCPDITTLR
ncbi:MAG: helix-turn-helix transcriptional regulator [Advenella sp.]|uniref:helix-turn-helix transcriptional regulator n=1 Tax=Advenella sp. TaxID=1872388 RepID=UPI003F95A881